MSDCFSEPQALPRKPQQNDCCYWTTTTDLQNQTIHQTESQHPQHQMSYWVKYQVVLAKKASQRNCCLRMRPMMTMD